LGLSQREAMPISYTLRQLHYIVAVGDTGSVTLAAEKVNVSAPSVSAAIAQVEADLGVALFLRRHAQGLVPTEAGRRIIAQARVALAEAARIEEIAAEVTGRVMGPLHLGCLQTFAPMVMPALRRAFSAAHPAVTLSASEGHQGDLIEGLRQGRLDAALTYEMTIPADLSFFPISALAPYLVLPLDHALAGRGPVSLHDLAREPLILLDLPLSSDYFLSLFAALGLKPRIAERARDIGMLRGLVAHGFGYGLLNIRPAGRQGPGLAPDGHAVAMCELSDPLPALRLGLAMAKGADSRRSLKALLTECNHSVPKLLARQEIG
jgi:DNA-binding transcriptional LysR family regulator